MTTINTPLYKYGVAPVDSAGGGASSVPAGEPLTAPTGIRPACGLPALRLRRAVLGDLVRVAVFVLKRAEKLYE